MKSLGVWIFLVFGLGKFVIIYIEIFKNIILVNVGFIIMFIICIIILVFVKDFINEKFKFKLFMLILIDLIFVILGIVIFYFGELNFNFNIFVVGNILFGVFFFIFFDLRIGIIGDFIVVVIIVFVLIIFMVKVCEIKNVINVD